eukprot:gene2317-3041_t
MQKGVTLLSFFAHRGPKSSRSSKPQATCKSEVTEGPSPVTTDDKPKSNIAEKANEATDEKATPIPCDPAKNVVEGVASTLGQTVIRIGETAGTTCGASLDVERASTSDPLPTEEAMHATNLTLETCPKEQDVQMHSSEPAPDTQMTTAEDTAVGCDARIEEMSVDKLKEKVSKSTSSCIASPPTTKRGLHKSHEAPAAKRRKSSVKGGAVTLPANIDSTFTEEKIRELEEESAKLTTFMQGEAENYKAHCEFNDKAELKQMSLYEEISTLLTENGCIDSGNVSVTTIRNCILQVSERRSYGLQEDLDVDILEDRSPERMWRWQVRGEKLIPTNCRELVLDRRKQRGKVQLRLRAVTSTLSVLRTADLSQDGAVRAQLLSLSKVDDFQKTTDLLIEQRERRAAQREKKISKVSSKDLEKAKHMSEKDAAKEEARQAKELEKQRTREEKEREREMREAEKEAARKQKELEKEALRKQKEQEKEAVRKQKEEERQAKEEEKQKLEAEKDRKRRESDGAARKKEEQLEKARSMMAMFVRKPKAESTSPSPKGDCVGGGGAAAAEASTAKVTLEMDEALAGRLEVSHAQSSAEILAGWKQQGSGQRRFRRFNERRPAHGADSPPSGAQRVPRKLLQFDSDVRPAFYGSWPTTRPAKTSAAVLPRRPLGRDAQLDYEEDSADEWEEEEPGESLSDADGEDGDDEEKMGEAAEEEEDGFVVPDGYLSDEEGGAFAAGVDMEVDKTSMTDEAGKPLQGSDLRMERLCRQVRAQQRRITAEPVAGQQRRITAEPVAGQQRRIMAEPVAGQQRRITAEPVAEQQLSITAKFSTSPECAASASRQCRSLWGGCPSDAPAAAEAATLATPAHFDATSDMFWDQLLALLVEEKLMDVSPQLLAVFSDAVLAENLPCVPARIVSAVLKSLGSARLPAEVCATYLWCLSKAVVAWQHGYAQKTEPETESSIESCESTPLLSVQVGVRQVAGPAAASAQELLSEPHLLEVLQSVLTAGAQHEGLALRAMELMLALLKTTAENSEPAVVSIADKLALEFCQPQWVELLEPIKSATSYTVQQTAMVLHYLLGSEDGAGLIHRERLNTPEFSEQFTAQLSQD